MSKVRLSYLNLANTDGEKSNQHLNKNFLAFRWSKKASRQTNDWHKFYSTYSIRKCMCSGKQLRMQIFWINQQNVCNISFCMRAIRVLNRIQWRWPIQCSITQWVKPQTAMYIALYRVTVDSLAIIDKQNRSACVTDTTTTTWYVNGTKSGYLISGKFMSTGFAQ